MDPLAIGANLLKRVNLSPEILEDFPSLFSSPEQAAEFARKHIASLSNKTCPDTAKEFVCGEFNQFEGCHRSPYSDRYVPDNPRGRFPAKTLREVEMRGNDILSEYVKCYYGDANSSFYVSETTDRGYMAYFAILKETYASRCEALHTISLNYEGHHKTHFKLTSYLKLNLKGSITSLNCNLEKQVISK
jgi:hypothetical protein